jgi:hypothetical protein
MLLEYLEPYDNYIEFVKAWLEEASQSEAWKHHVEESRQLTLF